MHYRRVVNPLVGVQATLELSRFTHLVASVGWAHLGLTLGFAYHLR